MFNSLLCISGFEIINKKEGFCFIDVCVIVEDVVDLYYFFVEECDIIFLSEFDVVIMFVDFNLLF